MKWEYLRYTPSYVGASSQNIQELERKVAEKYPRWTYKKDTDSMEFKKYWSEFELLDLLGDLGWELVSSTSDEFGWRLMFKRPESDGDIS